MKKIAIIMSAVVVVMVITGCASLTPQQKEEVYQKINKKDVSIADLWKIYYEVPMREDAVEDAVLMEIYKKDDTIVGLQKVIGKAKFGLKTSPLAQMKLINIAVKKINETNSDEEVLQIIDLINQHEACSTVILSYCHAKAKLYETKRQALIRAGRNWMEAERMSEIIQGKTPSRSKREIKTIKTILIFAR